MHFNLKKKCVRVEKARYLTVQSPGTGNRNPGWPAGLYIFLPLYVSLFGIVVCELPTESASGSLACVRVCCHFLHVGMV